MFRKATVKVLLYGIPHCDDDAVLHVCSPCMMGSTPHRLLKCLFVSSPCLQKMTNDNTQHNQPCVRFQQQTCDLFSSNVFQWCIHSHIDSKPKTAPIIVADSRQTHKNLRHLRHDICGFSLESLGLVQTWYHFYEQHFSVGDGNERCLAKWPLLHWCDFVSDASGRLCTAMFRKGLNGGISCLALNPCSGAFLPLSPVQGQLWYKPYVWIRYALRILKPCGFRPRLHHSKQRQSTLVRISCLNGLLLLKWSYKNRSRGNNFDLMVVVMRRWGNSDSKPLDCTVGAVTDILLGHGWRWWRLGISKEHAMLPPQSFGPFLTMRSDSAIGIVLPIHQGWIIDTSKLVGLLWNWLVLTEHLWHDGT